MADGGSQASASQTQAAEETKASGRQRPSIWSAFSSLSPSRESDRLSKGRIPCMRDSLLMGAGTGAIVTGVGAIAQRGLGPSLRWGGAAFIFVAIAAHQTCKSSQAAEAKRMKVIVEDFQRRRGGREIDADKGSKE